MSARSQRARLGKLGVTPAQAGPTCRWHDQACGLGRTWPLRFEPLPFDDLIDLIENGRRSNGEPPTPTRRERWAHQDHEQVPPAELVERAAELAVLIAEAEVDNERQYEAIIANAEVEREERRVTLAESKNVADGPL